MFKFLKEVFGIEDECEDMVVELPKTERQLLQERFMREVSHLNGTIETAHAPGANSGIDIGGGFIVGHWYDKFGEVNYWSVRYNDFILVHNNKFDPYLNEEGLRKYIELLVPVAHEYLKSYYNQKNAINFPEAIK